MTKREGCGVFLLSTCISIQWAALENSLWVQEVPLPLHFKKKKKVIFESHSHIVAVRHTGNETQQWTTVAQNKLWRRPVIGALGFRCRWRLQMVETTSYNLKKEPVMCFFSVTHFLKGKPSHPKSVTWRSMCCHGDEMSYKIRVSPPGRRGWIRSAAVSKNIHINVRTRGFPAERCIVTRWSKLFK